MDDRKRFISKIGDFFILLTAGMIFLFVASDVGGNNPQFIFFVVGVLCGVAAWYLKRISAPPPPPPSKRFEWLRKWQQKMKEDRAKREAAKKAKEEKRKK